MHGLAYSAFYIPIPTPIETQPSKLWSCSTKKILYQSQCNYIPYLISVCTCAIVFVLAAGMGKFILSYYNPGRHKLCWNHINNFYWLFCFVGFFVVYGGDVYLVGFVCAFLGLVTVLIWYQSIKNIFTVTYT